MFHAVLKFVQFRNCIISKHVILKVGNINKGTKLYRKMLQPDECQTTMYSKLKATENNSGGKTLYKYGYKYG